MRHFGSANNRLRRLALGQRVIYTVFLIFSLLALVSAVLLYDQGPGWTLESVRLYYRGGVEDNGDSGEVLGSTEARGTGPAIALPEFDPANQRGEPGSHRIAHPRSYRQILENTHQHLFMMPVMFLVLAHLFAMSGLGRLAIHTTITVSALGVAGHVAGPWLVRFLGGQWAWVMPSTLAALILGFGGMIGVSLVGMWAVGASGPSSR